jgi:hypothetical protein
VAFAFHETRHGLPITLSTSLSGSTPYLEQVKEVNGMRQRETQTCLCVLYLVLRRLINTINTPFNLFIHPIKYIGSRG